MSTKQKGGNKPKNAKVEAPANEAGEDVFMSKLTKEKRNLLKKITQIDAIVAKGGEMNEDQKAKVARKAAFAEEIKVLEQYMDLYAKANPKWDEKVEEKVEVP